MKRAATTMLGALFATVNDGEFIDLRRISRERGAVEEFVDARDIDTAVQWATDRRQAGDVYVGVLPRTRRDGGRAAVPAGRVLWADCDSPESVAALNRFPVEPSIVVLSGSGENRHAYWLLEQALDSARIEQLNRRLATVLESDQHVYDAARMLRPLSVAPDRQRGLLAARALDDASGSVGCGDDVDG